MYGQSNNNNPDPSKITVQGTFISTYEITLGNGNKEIIIACACSEQVCYTINRCSINGNNGNGELESDCGASLIDYIPLNSTIKLTKNDGTLIYEGIFVSYSNYFFGGNLLNRNNKFIFNQ